LWEATKIPLFHECCGPIKQIYKKGNKTPYIQIKSVDSKIMTFLYHLPWLKTFSYGAYLVHAHYVIMETPLKI